MPIWKCFLLAFTALSFSVTLVAQSVPGVTLERNATMKTRDGVTLVADVYRPADGQKHAVLLTRTPYNKDNMAPIGMKAAQRGFVVVIQDTRGRLNSDGNEASFKHESADGYDAVEWAAALPGSDGRVGMFSGSYVGATQMLAAIASTAASGRHLPSRHRLQLLRKLDLPRWCLRAVVQSILDIGPRAGHDHAPGRRKLQCSPGRADAAPYRIPGLQLGPRPHRNRRSARQRSSLPTTRTGSHIPPTTTTGSNGPSKRTTRTFRFPR